jgi:hypothetical protein
MIIRQYFKSERETVSGGFRYWMAHWAMVNYIALKLGRWRVRYLFHDIEKPWMDMLYDHKFTKKYHVTHSRHHIEYAKAHPEIPLKDACDWQEMVLDFESARVTKAEKPLDAYDTIRRMTEEGAYGMPETGVYLTEAYHELGLDHIKVLPVMVSDGTHMYPETVMFVKK